MEFKVMEIESKKLNRKVEVEGYVDTDNEVIIANKSLQKVFESVKIENGIHDSYTSDVRFSADGAIVYASVDWRLQDKDGYDSTFIGEAVPATLTTDVAKKYPKITALNRAQAAGIIAYLQIPGKAYSDVQRDPNSIKVKPTAVHASATHTDPKPEDSTVKETTNNTETVEEMPKAAITSAPTLNEELPYNDEETVEPTETVVPQAEAPTVEAPVTTPEPTVEKTETFDLNTKVGIGKLADLTVSELFAAEKNGDVAAVKFITYCKKGVLDNKDPEKQKVIEFIKNHE